MATEAKPSGEPGWKWRRLIIFPVVAFACWQLFMLKDAMDTQLNAALAYGWHMLVGLLVIGYSGLATIQDAVAIWRTKNALPYAPPSAPEQPQ